jgi:hypothetical protein
VKFLKPKIKVEIRIPYEAAVARLGNKERHTFKLVESCGSLQKAADIQEIDRQKVYKHIKGAMQNLRVWMTPRDYYNLLARMKKRCRMPRTLGVFGKINDETPRLYVWLTIQQLRGLAKGATTQYGKEKPLVTRKKP